MSQAQLLYQGQSHGLSRYSLAGVLDFQTVPSLLRDGNRMLAGEGPLDLDLVEVHEANSAGLALLLEWIDLAGRRGRPLRLYNLPESLVDLADLANLGPLLPLADI
ncbi:MAG: STAS domain-containing protein [Chromatiaceae bacterium]